MMWSTPTPNAFRKRFSAFKTDWRILWPSMHSQCWMREKSHLPAWLKDWIVKFGDVPAWSESFWMKVPMFAWWQCISWNTLRSGLSPELISARNPLWQLCSLLPNFIFFRSPFCEHYLTRSQKLKRSVTAKMQQSSSECVDIFADDVVYYVID